MQRTQKERDLGIEVLRDWGVEALGRWGVASLGRCVVGRVENHRGHRNLQRTQKKFFLGVLCVLGDLGVPIHRLTQIYTD